MSMGVDEAAALLRAALARSMNETGSANRKTENLLRRMVDDGYDFKKFHMVVRQHTGEQVIFWGKQRVASAMVVAPPSGAFVKMDVEPQFTKYLVPDRE